MTETLKDLASHIEDMMGGAILNSSIEHGELTVSVKREDIVRVLNFLHDDPSCRFTQLIDLCGVDYPERGERFDVVYHLLSLTQNERIRIKLSTDDKTPVESCIQVYKAADWFEREAFDMYGILFSGHPDLRRLLTDYGFDGFPLRKDFPLTGYTEVRYDDEAKRIVYEPVKLTQEFRTFENLSPWEGPEYVLPGDEKATK